VIYLFIYIIIILSHYNYKIFLIINQVITFNVKYIYYIIYYYTKNSAIHRSYNRSDLNVAYCVLLLRRPDLPFTVTRSCGILIETAASNFIHKKFAYTRLDRLYGLIAAIYESNDRYPILNLEQMFDLRDLTCKVLGNVKFVSN
jgi:hypothetical protein